MIVRPSPSYQIELPDQIVQEHEERVSSFWLPGEEVLLQLSSYRRTEGTVVSAQQRLTDRIAKGEGGWTLLTLKLLADPTADEACAEQLKGTAYWLHCYLVWPHLTIYTTIIGPVADVRNASGWARESLSSLTLVAG
ncbi:MAG: hypothetical protein NVSMB62_28150 [Acidobacteriaceae bacterium]